MTTNKSTAADPGASKYNALDNMKMAHEFRQQLVLEVMDLRASIEYARAVDHEDMDEEEEWLKRITQLIEDLSFYIGEGSS